MGLPELRKRIRQKKAIKPEPKNARIRAAKKKGLELARKFYQEFRTKVNPSFMAQLLQFLGMEKNGLMITSFDNKLSEELRKFFEREKITYGLVNLGATKPEEETGIKRFYLLRGRYKIRQLHRMIEAERGKMEDFVDKTTGKPLTRMTLNLENIIKKQGKFYGYPPEAIYAHLERRSRSTHPLIAFEFDETRLTPKSKRIMQSQINFIRTHFPELYRQIMEGIN